MKMDMMVKAKRPRNPSLEYLIAIAQNGTIADELYCTIYNEVIVTIRLDYGIQVAHSKLKALSKLRLYYSFLFNCYQGFFKFCFFLIFFKLLKKLKIVIFPRKNIFKIVVG